MINDIKTSIIKNTQTLKLTAIDWLNTGLTNLIPLSLVYVGNALPEIVEDIDDDLLSETEAIEILLLKRRNEKSI